MTLPHNAVIRGDVWSVRFDPSEGDEIQKIRPAVVMTAQGVGRMRLHIVVPITSWQPQFVRYFWMVRLIPSELNNTFAKIL
jgi:mRNA interferase MazF